MLPRLPRPLPIPTWPCRIRWHPVTVTATVTTPGNPPVAVPVGAGMVQFFDIDVQAQPTRGVPIGNPVAVGAGGRAVSPPRNYPAPAKARQVIAVFTPANPAAHDPSLGVVNFRV